MPGEQGACHKTGPSREKVPLGDFRGEVVSQEKPASIIRGEGMKGAVSEVRLRGYWFGTIPYICRSPEECAPMRATQPLAIPWLDAVKNGFKAQKTKHYRLEGLGLRGCSKGLFLPLPAGC